MVCASNIFSADFSKFEALDIDFIPFPNPAVPKNIAILVAAFIFSPLLKSRLALRSVPPRVNVFPIGNGTEDVSLRGN